jgi:undecaprenyl-diphosphatase
MIKHPTTIFPQFYVNAQYSYPSGHTARAVFLGMALFSVLAGPFELWKTNWRKTGIIAACILAYIFAVAISRIYLGEHWLSDVLGGALLGAGFGGILLAL